MLHIHFEIEGWGKKHTSLLRQCCNTDDSFTLSQLILLAQPIIPVKQIQILKMQNWNPHFALGGSSKRQTHHSSRSFGLLITLKNAKKSHLHVKLLLGEKPQHKHTEVWLIAALMAAFHLAPLNRGVLWRSSVTRPWFLSSVTPALSSHAWTHTHLTGPGSKPHTHWITSRCVWVCVQAQRWWPVRGLFLSPTDCWCGFTHSMTLYFLLST